MESSHWEGFFLFDFFENLWYNIYTKMRGEKKMITADFVNEAISKVVERFEDGDYIRRTYYEVVQEDDEVGPEENHFFIEDEIDTLLTGLNIPHSVELVEAFENPGIDIWVVCVAFFVEGEVESYNIVVERH